MRYPCETLGGPCQAASEPAPSLFKGFATLVGHWSIDQAREEDGGNESRHRFFSLPCMTAADFLRLRLLYETVGGQNM